MRMESLVKFPSPQNISGAEQRCEIVMNNWRGLWLVLKQWKTTEKEKKLLIVSYSSSGVTKSILEGVIYTLNVWWS